MRALRILSKIVGVLVVLVVLLVIGVALLFDFDEELNTQKDKYLPEVQKLLGRQVAVGRVETTFFPVLGARISEVVVRGKTAEEDALLSLGQIEFRVNIWRALASAGTDVQLDALVLDGLDVNLIREADGSLSYQDVVDRLVEGPPPDETPAPLDPEAIKFIKSLKLSRIALQNGRFHLVDKATGGAPAETEINDLLVELNDVYLSSPFEVRVGASVFAESPNFELRVRLGPIPIGDPNAVMPVDWITLKADGIDLARITPYLGDAVPVRVASAQFGADLRIDDPTGAKGQIAVGGALTIANLAIGSPKAGRPFTLMLAPNVKVDPSAGTVDLEGFKLGLDEMILTADGHIEGLDANVPSFEGVKLRTQQFHLGRLIAMLPDIGANLPPGAKLDGPFSLAIDASGTPEAQDIVLDFDFGGATIIVPGGIHKPAGTPLRTEIEAGVTPNDLDLRKFTLTLGDLVLGLSGTVKDFANPRIDMRGGTKRFDINGPVRLMPSVAEAIPPDVHVAGTSEIKLELLKTADKIDARILLGIYDANLVVPGTTVRGTGSFEVSATGNPAGAMAVAFDAKLGGLDLDLGEAMRKPPGTPLDARVRVNKSGDSIQVGDLLVNFGPVKLTGGGTAHLGSGALDVKATIARFKIGDLGRMMPAILETPVAAGTVGMSLAFTGNPNQISTVNAELSDFYFGLGKSSLSGRASVANPDAPVIRFNFTSPNLDLDEMFPPSDEESPEEESGEPPEIIRKIDAQGSIAVKKGRAGGFPFKNFDARMTMNNGVVKFSTLDFDSYGGHFSMAPTSANIGSAVPSFDVSVSMKDVESERLLADQTDMKKKTLSGRMSSTIKIKGTGAEWETLSQNLTGGLGMSLANGRFHRADFRREIIKPLSSKVPGLKAPKGPAGTALKNLAAQFSIADGKMTLDEPMRVETPDGPVVLDGYIGLDTSLHLKGTYEVAPSLIAAATGNKVQMSKAAPVGLELGGTLEDPKITGVDVGDLAEEIAKSLAMSLGAEKVLEMKRKAEALAREQVERARAEADAARRQAEEKVRATRDKAEKKAREAKKKAEAAKKKAEAKARKEKEKAKKKAEDAAKKKLKGLF